jgi:membrane protein YdbS with pleckstrin-like domain
MSLQSDERILRQARIHPGIFGLPVMLLVVILLPAIPLLFFFNMLGNMMSQFSPQGVGFHLTALWFFIIGMDLFAALLVFIPVLVAYLNCEITLTNKRLIYRTGFLVRAAGELPLENVEAMFILEPLLGRLLGYGTVAVSTLGGLQFPLRFIGKPCVFHAALQRAVADAKAPSRRPPKPPPQPLDDYRYMARA